VGKRSQALQQADLLSEMMGYHTRGHNCITNYTQLGVWLGVRRRKKVADFMGEWVRGGIGGLCHLCTCDITITYIESERGVVDTLAGALSVPYHASYNYRTIRHGKLQTTNYKLQTTNYKLQITGLSTPVRQYGGLGAVHSDQGQV